MNGTPLISPDMRRAALIRQDSAARSRVRPAHQSWKDSPIMTQALAEALTHSQREQVINLTENMYRTALEILRDANELRETVGLLPPEGVVDLDSYRVPRQAAVSR